MAQTIAEKLAEKYDVTPSTTIAGTLKKITNDETGDVNIASLVSKMEAGGGQKRRLVAQAEELAFERGTDPIVYATLDSRGFFIDEPIFINVKDESHPKYFDLEIDDELVLEHEAWKLPSGSTQPAIGLTNPGDTETLAAGKNYGVSFAMATGTTSWPQARLVVYQFINVMANSEVFDSTGTHNVKIYLWEA